MSDDGSRNETGSTASTRRKRGRATPPAEAPGKAVLVTGATSGLGRQLVRHLYYDPGVRYVLGLGIEARPYFFDQYDASKFHYARVDITRSREMKNLFYSDLFKDLSFDAIAHLAIRNRPVERDPQAAHRLNLQGTRNVLQFGLETESVRRFIFSSSHIVYRADPLNPVYLDEEAELNFDIAANRWIKDRVDADLLCRTRMEDDRLDIVVLRFSNIVGRNIHRYMDSYLNSPLALHPMGFDPMVNLLHPRDAVRAIQLALEKEGVQGVFNVPGKETGPLSKIARINGTRQVGVPGAGVIKVLNRLQRAVRMTDFYAEVDINRLYHSCLIDGSRARDVLGYEPRNHVELG